jgi:hypothetical protein
VKRDEELQVDTDHAYSLIEQYLEEAINTSIGYESSQENDIHDLISENIAHASISIHDRFCDKCMNLLFLSECYNDSILYEGVDACVLGVKDERFYLSITQEEKIW